MRNISGTAVSSELSVRGCLKDVTSSCVECEGVCVVRGVSDTADPSTTAANDDIFSYLNANRRQGTWAESETEKVIRCIATFAKSYKGDSFC